MTYTFSLGYNLHYKNPFSTYGENAFLIIQAIIILFLLKMYDSNLSAIKFWVSQIFYIVFCFVLFTDIVPEEVHQFSMIITIIFRKFILSYITLVICNSLFIKSPTNSIEFKQ